MNPGAEKIGGHGSQEDWIICKKNSPKESGVQDGIGDSADHEPYHPHDEEVILYPFGFLAGPQGAKADGKEYSRGSRIQETRKEGIDRGGAFLIVVEYGPDQ